MWQSDLFLDAMLSHTEEEGLSIWAVPSLHSSPQTIFHTVLEFTLPHQSYFSDIYVASMERGQSKLPSFFLAYVEMLGRMYEKFWFLSIILVEMLQWALILRVEPTVQLVQTTVIERGMLSER